MITGFNTDIEFQGVTYHVQTEDKGLETPLILSLVYDRGTILASKRSPYNDLLGGAFSEKELAERLQRQHKLICAAVRAGRIEDLKQMTLKESAAKRQNRAEQQQSPPPPVPPSLPSLQKKKQQTLQPVAVISTDARTKEKTVNESTLPVPPPPPPPPVAAPSAAVPRDKNEIRNDDVPAPQLLKKPAPPTATTPQTQLPPLTSIPNVAGNGARLGDDVLEIPLSILEDLIVEEVQVVEEETILPAEAVEIVAEVPASIPKPPPTVFEPADESLRLELLNDVTFKSGERKVLSVHVGRGTAANGLSGAHVMVKILGSSFRPMVFHAKTDANGVATLHLQLPKFSRGRAAVLVRAMSGGEETELRRIISQD